MDENKKFFCNQKKCIEIGKKKSKQLANEEKKTNKSGQKKSKGGNANSSATA